MIFLLVFLPLSILLVLGFLSFYGGRTSRYAIILPLSFSLYELMFLIIKSPDQTYDFNFGNWVTLEYFEVFWELTFNNFTLLSSGIIIFLSLSIQLYSIDYMNTDLNIIYFIILLTLFTFSMSIFVYSSNSVLLLTGWEGIGVLSYLLINFWTSRIEAAKASLKAVFINKFGDTALIISFLFLFNIFLSTSLTVINSLALYIKFETITGIMLLALISLLLVIAGITKSAQLIFSVWLPDAMEGPTPVSSLLHSATMVVAGLLLLIKLSVVLNQTTYLLPLLLVVGFLTALTASCESLCTGDIKSSLASSTCEQIGLMFIIYGMGYLNLAFFHFCTHAFYKSFAFLSVGLVIHAFGESEGEFSVGWDEDTLSSGTAPVSAAAIMGLPGTIGHYSKSIIFSVLYSQGIFYSSLFYLFNQLLQFNNNACSALMVLSIASIGAEFSTRKTEYILTHYSILSEGFSASLILLNLAYIVLWVGPIIAKLYAFRLFPRFLSGVSWDISWLYYKSLPSWVIYGTLIILVGTTFILFLYKPIVTKLVFLQPIRSDHFYYDKWFNLVSLWYIRIAYDLGFYCINNCISNFYYYFSRIVFSNLYLTVLYTTWSLSWTMSYQIVFTLFFIFTLTC